jgi:hypothetical protein
LASARSFARASRCRRLVFTAFKVVLPAFTAAKLSGASRFKRSVSATESWFVPKSWALAGWPGRHGRRWSSTLHQRVGKGFFCDHGVCVIGSTVVAGGVRHRRYLCPPRPNGLRPLLVIHSIEAFFIGVHPPGTTCGPLDNTPPSLPSVGVGL